MKVIFTFSAALRLAFWLFLLGVVLGLALRVPAAGEPQQPVDPGPSSVDARVLPAPAY
ncbi:MAG TPA: hypothetical protein VFV67_09215 [Actinophytocola sp.]|uniref:hypothetical protein n=1 Tax=Actinophytocola sp. TaxID=1872138 RepID=UPI002DBE9CD3|nr:hypothetical protein [Actinophytocola sp.]HEU5470821.1 hypothetical protein [Actinophytocola sp.]